MTPAALLPHESPCPDCEDGRVPVSYATTSPTAEEPSLSSERFVTCRRCNGTGIVIDERRTVARDSGSPLVEAFRHVRVDLDRANITVAQLQHHVDALLVENRRYRDAIDKAASVMERMVQARTGKGDSHETH